MEPCTKREPELFLAGKSLNDGIAELEDKYIFMQNTSLVDKHLKEIYEDDLLRVSHEDQYINVRVMFLNGMFCVATEYISYCKPLISTSGVYCEIVGNIHENPALLTQ